MLISVHTDSVLTMISMVVMSVVVDSGTILFSPGSANRNTRLKSRIEITAAKHSIFFVNAAQNSLLVMGAVRLGGVRLLDNGWLAPPAGGAA